MSDTPGDSFFHTTRWSIVLNAAADLDGANAGGCGSAFEELCQLYWRPLYGFLRRSGLNEHEAQDLTQAFFVRILEKPVVQAADRTRGKFRTFLLASLKNFLSHERERSNSQRRGGRRVHVSTDFSEAESWLQCLPKQTSTPEEHFERCWALEVMEQVLGRLKAEYEQAGKHELFSVLQPHLTIDSQRLPYQETAEQLGMEAGAVKVAVHRLRKKYRRIMKEVIGETVSSPDEIEGELRHLLASLG